MERDILQRIQSGFAIAGVVFATLAVIWSILNILRRPVGPYQREFITVAMGTGAFLWALKFIVPLQARESLAGTSSAGFVLFVIASLAAMWKFRQGLTVGNSSKRDSSGHPIEM